MAIGIESIAVNTHSGETVNSGKLKYHDTDEPYALASGREEAEQRRLNSQHYGIKAYFGGNHTGAQWPTSPKKILEISVGSGVWATEVAEQFPDAEVIGVDIVEPVLQRKPKNFTFQSLNVVKDPWPFAPDTFDIVHCRFLCMHVPRFGDLVTKAIESTAPGGIVMFEDQDLCFRSDVKPVPHQAALFLAIFNGFGESLGVNTRVGKLFAPLLLASKQLSETHETVVTVPYGGWSEDERLKVIGLGMHTGFIEAARTLSPKLFQFGMTNEIVEAMVKEMLNKENKLYIDLCCVWGRKRKANVY